ncbi:hypothetical protein JG687_00010011, partial [Phytophthora cactorum]
WYSWCSSAQRRHLYRVATKDYDDLIPGDGKTFSVPDDLYEYKDLDKDAAATAIRKIDEVKKVGEISPNFMISQCWKPTKQSLSRPSHSKKAMTMRY